MRDLLLVAALASLAPGCSSSDDIDVAEITVHDHLVPCRLFVVWDCMVVDESSGSQSFYDRIEGFTYQWGSTYRLEVDIVTIHNPLPDASSREVHLRKILDVQPVTPHSEFTLALRGDAYPGGELLTPVGQGFAMTLGRQIVCQDPRVCTAITDALRQPAAFDLTLRHPDDPTNEQLPLTAVAVILH
jgi:hypothetical protein